MDTTRIELDGSQSVQREPQASDAVEPSEPLAWQEIAAGRYQPRRIRGSCRGRELG
jgi:hypothetical protein